MSLKKQVTMLATLAAATAMASPTAASVEGTIHLRAHVPIYCNISLVSPVGASDDGLVPLGRSQELCNAPRGYRVILQHPVNLQNAAVMSNAERIPLSPSGETILASSDHPDLQVRQLALDLGREPATINRLGLRIEVNY